MPVINLESFWSDSDAILMARDFRQRAECRVCEREDVTEVNARLARGVRPIVFETELGIHHETLRRHINDCLQTSLVELRASHRHLQANDIEQRFKAWLEEAETLYEAAKDVLLVNGKVDMNPRSHEVSIVYLDHNDLNERTHEPKIKTGLLSELLAKVESGGYEPQHSYIKSEDARKNLRECVKTIKDLLAELAKITGAYKEAAKNKANELEEIRTLVQNVALKMGTTYTDELSEFLRIHGDRLRPDLRGMLLKESQDTVGALPAGAREDFALPPSSTIPAGAIATTIESEVYELEVTKPSPGPSVDLTID